MNTQLPGFLERYMPNRAEGGNILYFHPFVESHLGSNHITFGGGITGTSDIRYVYVFSAVGLFILVIACINFVNLTTARSAHRAAEIGVRKVVGAHREQLIRQFLKLILLANVIAWPIAYFAIRDWLADFAYRVSIGPLEFVEGALTVMVVALTTVAYQAVRAATTNPVDALKNE